LHKTGVFISGLDSNKTPREKLGQRRNGMDQGVV